MIVAGNTLCKVVTPISEDSTSFIKGHINDESSTFTFKINNTDITVNVDSNGWWKWIVDRTITTLFSFLNEKKNIDEIIFNNVDLSQCSSLYYSFRNCMNLKKISGLKNANFNSTTNIAAAFYGCESLERIDLSSATFKNVTESGSLFSNNIALNELLLNNATFEKGTSINYEFQYCQDITTLSMPNATFESVTQCRYAFGMMSRLKTLYLPKASFKNIENNIQSQNIFSSQRLENITIKENTINLVLGTLSRLTKQSIINLINAAVASVTYTLAGTVYAKCANGGEWYTDVQAAIDAKALEGYTVTLISA